MWTTLLLLCALAAAAPEAEPGGSPSPPSPAPAETNAAEPEPEAEEAKPNAEIVVTAAPPVARARDELSQALRAQGYRAGVRRGEWTVFRSYTPYRPDVRVHDDGWIDVRRAKIRVHPPGKSFADEGSPISWLWCALPVALPFCISVGGQVISPAKLHALKEDVYEGTREEVAALGDAVTQVRMEQRLNVDIPSQLEALWAEEQVPAAIRRAALLEWWDSRTETPEGEAARDAASAFMNAVVQTSTDPFSAAEIAAYNKRRSCARELYLRPASPAEPAAP